MVSHSCSRSAIDPIGSLENSLHSFPIRPETIIRACGVLVHPQSRIYSFFYVLLFCSFFSNLFPLISSGAVRQSSITASLVLQPRSSQIQGMDTTFYEDSKNYFSSGRSREEMRELKRPMTLDLDSGRNSKKFRGPTALLTSPDLNMLKLASPELEKLIIANHGYEGNTPTAGQCMYPSKNEEREPQYAREFADALSGMPSNGMYQQPHHIQSDINISAITNNTTCNIMPPSSMPCSTTNMVDSYGYQQPPLSAINLNCNPMVSSTMSSNNCYAPVNQGGGFYQHEPIVSIKEEPQTVPCMGGSPPQSPIDMEDQERMKLERKRLRNRIAASKCRRRKLERIARLEDKVSHLKNENSELNNHVQRLREQVCHLKQQVMDHVQSGCEFATVASNYSSYADDL